MQHRQGESITAPRHRGYGGVTEQFSEHHDLDVEVVVLDDKPWPGNLHQLMFRDDAVTVQHQRYQHIECAAADLDGPATGEQRPASGLKLEMAERERDFLSHEVAAAHGGLSSS